MRSHSVLKILAWCSPKRGGTIGHRPEQRSHRGHLTSIEVEVAGSRSSSFVTGRRVTRVRAATVTRSVGPRCSPWSSSLIRRRSGFLAGASALRARQRGRRVGGRGRRRVDPGWIGRRVAGHTGNEGGYADRAVIAADGLSAVPDGLELTVAAALLHHGPTVLALFDVTRGADVRRRAHPATPTRRSPRRRPAPSHR